MTANLTRRLTRREWRAISEAIGFRLASEMEDDVDSWALATAQTKVWARLPPNDGSSA